MMTFNKKFVTVVGQNMMAFGQAAFTAVEPPVIGSGSIRRFRLKWRRRR